jgi:hypothetical protein
MKAETAERLIELLVPESPVIEVTSFLKKNKVKVQDLFSIACEKQDAELAHLAYELVVKKGNVKPPKRRSTRLSPLGISIPAEEINAGSVTKALTQKLSKWSVGTIMVLWGLSRAAQHGKSEDDPMSIKTISIDMVNFLRSNSLVQDENSIFRGFVQGSDGFLRPQMNIDKTSEEASHGIYSFSPIYTTLREGVDWAKRHGLIEATRKRNVGDTKEGAPRFFYAITLTDLGRSVFNEIERTYNALEVICSYLEKKDWEPMKTPSLEQRVLVTH